MNDDNLLPGDPCPDCGEDHEEEIERAHDASDMVGKLTCMAIDHAVDALGLTDKEVALMSSLLSGRLLGLAFSKVMESGGPEVAAQWLTSALGIAADVMDQKSDAIVKLTSEVREGP
jgi:hypothetical protein